MTSGRRAAAPAGLVLILAVAACRPTNGVEPTSFAGETMGTTYQVTYAPTSAKVADERAAIDDLLEEINRSMSTYIPESTISRINRSPDTGTRHPVDAHFTAVFVRSKQIYEDTGGAFNPAVAPLVIAWGFGPDGPRETPGAERVTELLETVRFEAFEFGPNGIRKTIPGAALDFSAIAKGYAVDRLAELLETWGVESYFVEIGGELRTRGQYPGAPRPWRIGIEAPTATATGTARALVVLHVTDAALATSGSYRNYIVQDGRRFAHILDPRTGHPATTGLLAVSVLASDTMTADAYATALMVMGIDDGARFVEEREGLEAYFVAADGAGGFTERRSTGFPD
jgi:thiamine biosynthesis lipoprotein